MSILFMGTPEWAIPSLKAVLDSGFPVSGVFTQPDKPAGRKRKLTPSPLKKFALEQGLEVYTPEKAGSPDSLEQVKSLKPDVIIVCAYGQILPQPFLDIARIGCFNLHFSFLPRWRGASPVQAAIASGDVTTGVSLQKMVLRLDAGPLLASSVEEKIQPQDTTTILGERLAEMGGQLIRNTLPKLMKGDFELVDQNEDDATYCRIIKKEEGKINWQQENAVQIERKLRAYSPWPGIFSTYSLSALQTEKDDQTSKSDFSSKRIQFTEVAVISGNYESGKIHENWIVGTAEGALKVIRLKPEGKQEMEAEAHLRGQPQMLGVVLD